MKKKKNVPALRFKGFTDAWEQRKLDSEITFSKGNGYLLEPIWKREKRPPYMETKKEDSQDKISMKWKYNPKLHKKR